MKFNHILLCGAIASVVAANAIAATTSKTVTTQGYVDTAVATKQDKLSGTNGYAVTYGSSAGQTEGRQIVTSLGSDTSATTLPTTGAVVTGLNAKQNTLNGSANTVVTYTGTAGSTGSKGVYQASGSYSSQTSNLAEAGHVNTAVTNAFNEHLTCNTYATPGDTTSDCLLWNVNTLSGTYMPQNQ
ncbi:MAG: hypothetical protein IJQ90_02635 [Alphaproteobacteria bacterium]|nr:hypothetical protein [Alphaproteobacteria bacterium]